jgi:hypothetical protein
MTSRQATRKSGILKDGGPTDKKENKIFLTYKEIQMGSGAKSYMRKIFLIMRKCTNIFKIYEEVVSHM